MDGRLETFRACFERLRRRERGEGTPPPEVEEESEEPASAFAEVLEETRAAKKKPIQPQDP